MELMWNDEGHLPGQLDPVTNGHLDIIQGGRDLRRGNRGGGEQPGQETLFTIEERVALLKEAI